MPSEEEAQRIAQVYSHYQNDAAIQAQWRADNPGNRAISRERRRAMRDALQRAGLWPLAGRRVLDVGCGSGRVLAGLRQWGARPADLTGVDLLPERVAAARRNYPEIDFRRANAERLDFPDASFHLVLVFTVFSSILDPGMAGNVAAEIRRVCAPGGAVLWYDFRYDNPRNPHVRGMGQGDVAALFPGWRLDLRSLTLLPPLARRLGRFTPWLYPLLSRFPFLRTHYLGVLARMNYEGRRKRRSDTKGQRGR